MAQFAEATNEYGDVITSSPAAMPARRQSRCSPAVPLDTAAAYGAPTVLGEQLLEAVDRRPERQPARAQHFEHELFLALVEPRRRERDLANGRGHALARASTTSSHVLQCSSSR